MITKEFTPKRTVCKAMLALPEEWAKNEVSVAGDFNDWDKNSDHLEKKKGKWSITLRLKPENEYRFKYFIDGERWQNDDAADKYVPNEFGTEDSVIVVGK
ncbi:MAG: isoamylase early set domain-containing protein [Gracilimonas sp.]|uniref:isoamylase early set domain-containing protein n=1 Tax=Gracilimonas sp. TaxID=1974203 RepID=UPI0019B71EAC|nr:isoamylase early set domain-containing protein [Gracilimonas sp.]MBD3617570.1 isoamylase early set domain-containing protein [Gracilimonas sp.]